MSADEGDRLIHRHLEGALSEEDAAALGARLKSDPAFRRRMAEMAFDRAQMKELLSSAGKTEVAPVATELAAAPRVPRRAVLPMAAAAIIVASVGIAVALWSFREDPGARTAGPGPAPEPKPGPDPKDPYRGFAGPVTGKVVSRTESAFSLRVSDVPGHPRHPMVGNLIHVVGGHTLNADGQPVADRAHQGYLRKLEPDQEETLDLRHQKGDIFAIGELTAAQLEGANRREDGRRRPAEDPPTRRIPDRPKREAGKDVPREGQDREPPRERPKEEE